MLFKYPMHTAVGDDIWTVVDGFDEINYQQGWFMVVESHDPEEAKAWTFGFSDKKPSEYKNDEVRGITIPDEIYVPDEWYKSLIAKKTDGISALHVTLRKNKDAVRLMIVSHAYLLNDEGRTVERLYPRVGM